MYTRGIPTMTANAMIIPVFTSLWLYYSTFSWICQVLFCDFPYFF